MWALLECSSFINYTKKIRWIKNQKIVLGILYLLITITECTIRLRSYCLGLNDLDPTSGNKVARIFISFNEIFYTFMSAYLHVWSFYLAAYFISRKRFTLRKRFKEFNYFDKAMVIWIYLAIIFEGVSELVRFSLKSIVYFPITQRNAPQFEAYVEKYLAFQLYYYYPVFEALIAYTFLYLFHTQGRKQRVQDKKGFYSPRTGKARFMVKYNNSCEAVKAILDHNSSHKSSAILMTSVITEGENMVTFQERTTFFDRSGTFRVILTQ